jgi:predicted nucleotide-binding protein
MSLMLEAACLAFLIMTGEDEHNGELHARENVIHEIGLFQGKLGFRRAIILLEEGCKDLSNIHGFTAIFFPNNAISYQVRRGHEDFTARENHLIEKVVAPAGDEMQSSG